MPSMEFLLSIGMLVTGALNTLSIKYQDRVVVAHTYDMKPITFYHPVVQCACMFLGEFLCIIPYLWQQWKQWNKKQLTEAAHEEASPHASRLVYLHGSSAAEPLLSSRLPQGMNVSPPLVSRCPPSNFSEVGYTSSSMCGTGEDVSQSVFVLALPTLCDATSSLLMNVGLFYTSASIFQMLRGLVVFWAGIFTGLILKRRLYLHHWQGMMLIVVGCFIVGLSSVLHEASYTPHHHYPPYEPPYGPPPEAPCGDPTNTTATLASSALRSVLGAQNAGAHCPGPSTPGYEPGGDGEGVVAGWLRRAAGVLLFGLPWDGRGGNPEDCKQSSGLLIGNLCVMAAQVFAALQYVVEEKYVKHYRIPASLAVGLEGFWGLILSCLLLPLFQNLTGPNGWPIDDAKHTVADIRSHPMLGLALAATILSFAFFNWSGLSLTISLSGAARLSIDACRTLLVWAVSLVMGWESFHTSQLLGFLVIMCGTTMYNELLAPLVEPSQSSAYRMGPQYRRTYVRPMPPGSVPYDVSPSLRIAVALTEPHSLGSMGGMHTPSPGAEFWGISLDPTSARSGRGSGPPARSTAVLTWGGHGSGAAAAAAAALPPRPAAHASVAASAPTAAPAAAGTMPSQQAARVPSMERSGSFYKYSAFYSGMDVGVTQPISTTGGLSVTPRPNELLANVSQQEWDGTAASARSGSLHPSSVPDPAVYQLQQATLSPPQWCADNEPAPPVDSASVVAAGRSMLSEQLSQRQDTLNLNIAQACQVPQSSSQLLQHSSSGTTAALASAVESAAVPAAVASAGLAAAATAVAPGLVAAPVPPPMPLAMPPLAAAAGAGALAQSTLRGPAARGLPQSSSEPALLARTRREGVASGVGLAAGGVHGRGGRTMSRRKRESVSRDSSAVVGMSAQSGLSDLNMSGEFNLR